MTGANGKTTTTAMIDHLLRNEGWDTDCVGGTSWARRLAERDNDEGQAQATVLEVSSQLDGTNTFRPNVGLLLNITRTTSSDSGTMAIYAASKWSITASHTDAVHLIYNSDC